MTIPQPRKLEHIGTPDTGKTGSPSFYRTDDGRYIAQGYKLTSPEARAQLVNCPPHEDGVVITQDLIDLIAGYARNAE